MLNNSEWEEIPLNKDDEWEDVPLGKPVDNNELSFRQGKETSFMDRVLSDPTELFNMFQDPVKEKAKAFMAVVNSEDMTKEIQKRDPNALPISPSFAYDNSNALNKHYDIDPIRKKSREDSFAAIQKFNDTGIKDDYLDTFWKSLQRFPPSMQEAAGGIIQAIEEDALPLMGLRLAGKLGIKEAENLYNIAKAQVDKKDVLSIGRDIIGAGAKQKLNKLGHNVMPGSFQESVAMATESTINNLAFLIPGFAYGKAIPLALMGLQSGGQSYVQQREGGSAPDTALIASVVNGMAEAGTEFIPMGIYLKPNAGLVKRLIEAEFSEIPTEVINTMINDVVDKTTLRPDMTVEDAIADIQQTIQVTALSTMALTGGTHSIHKIIAKTLPPAQQDTFNTAATDTINNGGTAQEAAKKGIDAVSSTPEGKLAVDQQIDKMKQEAVSIKKNTEPFILGVQDDNGEVTGFTMADPVSGKTFEVPALNKSKDMESDQIKLIPDSAAVNTEIAKIRQEDEIDIDGRINKLVEGDEDVNKIVNDIFGDEIVQPGAPSGGKQPLDMVDTDAVSFIAGRDKAKHTEFLTPYTPEELSGAKIKTVSGLEAGYAVKPGGDIVNVYNNTPHKGLGAVSVIDAVQKGGKTLDCVDNYLVQFYKSLGFVETKRVKFDPAQAPKNWDFEKHGSPDIVFLKHEGETNANYLKRSYETRWNRRLDADPVTAEVFDRINRRTTETSPEGVVSTTTNTTNKQGAIGTGVQRDLIPNPSEVSSLANPETEISKPLSQQATPKNAKLFDVSSILNPVEIVNNLRGLTSNIKEAMPHLEALGSQIYQSGKVKFSEWSAQMKETLGDLWESFKDAIKSVWANREKWVGNEIGAIGNIESPVHDVIAYIKENGGLNVDILSKQYPKETIDILKKKGLAKKDGYMQLDVVANEFQFEDDDLMNQILDVKSKNKIKAETSNKRQADYLKSVYNNEKVSREEFTKAVNDARKAFKEGNAAELTKLKKNLKWMATRKETLKNVRDYFGLTDNDMSKISKKNPLLMDEQEFAQYLKDVNYKAVELRDNRWAKIELMKLIEEKRLQKVDNYRKALSIPSIDKMTTDQLRQFAKLLEPFENDDIFLTQRELETMDKTDLKGIKTWREAREKLAQEAGVPIAELSKVKVLWNESYKWDSALREQDPFFDLLVTKMTESMMGAEMKAHNTETFIYDLVKKSESSRKRGLVERAIPQDEQIFAYLEAPQEEKAAVAQSMTPEQLNLAHVMNQYFANALDYLLAIKSVEKGRENYITHVRKSFFETVRDKGIKEGIGSIFTNAQEDQMGFNILDDDTGNILPLEKFFQFSMHRTGELQPTKNVVKAFMTYVQMFEKKRAFDAIIPKLDIYTQSLTPTRLTARGLEFDQSLKKFVKKWINNKKGRKISYDSVIRQGGPVDLGIRTLKTFTSMVDLGFYVPAQIINFAGEQLSTIVPLGVTDYVKSMGLMRTEKGKRILKKYEFFTGRSLWEEFTAPGKEVTGRLMEGMFGLFHVSTVAANKQFLLASMTKEEYANEELSLGRLAQMKLDMGRFRAIPGTNSLVGSTSIGGSAMQYKTWAVPITRSLIKDITTMSKNIKSKKYGEAFTSREAREIYRIIGLTSAVIMVSAMAGEDDDDKSLLAKMKARSIRELYSLTSGMNPVFWTSWRSFSFLGQLAKALSSIATLEDYETKEGLKGVDQLKKTVTPGMVRAFPDSEED